MTIEAGQVLPELAIDVTTTFVVASAIATRDFQDVHHDRDRAIARGSQDIFLNILTTTGLVQRYVTEWAGPEAIVRKIAIRLGVPCYAGDTLTFSGTVLAKDAEAVLAGAAEVAGAAGAPAAGPGGDCVVQVVGRCRLGDHVTGTVRLAAGGAGAGPDPDGVPGAERAGEAR